MHSFFNHLIIVLVASLSSKNKTKMHLAIRKNEKMFTIKKSIKFSNPVKKIFFN